MNKKISSDKIQKINYNLIDFLNKKIIKKCSETPFNQGFYLFYTQLGK